MKSSLKRMLSLVLALVLSLSLMSSAFAASSEAVAAANNLYSLGLFKGTGTNADGTPIFDLDLAPTRNEAVTMLVRLLGKEEEATSGTWSTPFTDVPRWAQPYVGYAYTNGLTNGTSATTYSGNETVSASQYLTFVLRSLGYEDGTDFTWNKAWELSDQIGLTSGEYNANTTSFTRGDVAVISYKSLSTAHKTIAATKISLNKTSVNLTVGNTEKVRSTVSPANATDNTLTWSSSDTSIATVENGVITAVAPGSATITVTNGTLSASCAVTVTPVKAKSISLSKTSIALKTGSTQIITAAISPENAADNALSWSSSDSNVATVDDGVITAVSPGSATITVTNGTLKATCSVTVSDIDVESVSLNESRVELNTGDSATLVATVSPSNATNKVVEWTSSNTSVATVTDSGVITAVSKGTAWITARAQSGRAYATCTVVVTDVPNITVTLETSLPFSCSYYSSSNKLRSSCTVNGFYYEVSNYTYKDEQTVYLYFSGTKTYDYRGSLQSDSCKIGWKLYDEDGYVVESGTCYSSTLAVGESFRDAKDYIFSLKEGNYYLKLSNVN